MASPFDQASVIPPHTKKTILDAWNGCHSLQLDNLSKDATTLITEWGRYRYRRAPRGFQAAGDAYNRWFDDITMDFPRKTKIVDDSLLWDNNIEDAFWHTLEYIGLCAKNGIVFNPKKFKFAMDEINFAGFNITPTGLCPSECLMDASLRTEVLQGLHAAHQGVAGMKARARYSVYWPGISAAIVNHRNTCRRSDFIAPSQSSESLCPPPEPEYPFQLVVSDFCEVAGQKFLIYGNRYSAWCLYQCLAQRAQAPSLSSLN